MDGGRGEEAWEGGSGGGGGRKSVKGRQRQEKHGGWWYMREVSEDERQGSEGGAREPSSGQQPVAADAPSASGTYPSLHPQHSVLSQACSPHARHAPGPGPQPMVGRLRQKPCPEKVLLSARPCLAVYTSSTAPVPLPTPQVRGAHARHAPGPRPQPGADLSLAGCLLHAIAPPLSPEVQHPLASPLDNCTHTLPPRIPCTDTRCTCPPHTPC